MKYTDQARQRIVIESFSSTSSVADISRKYGASPSTIRRWRRQQTLGYDSAVLKTLEDKIASHYINSNDFNGVAIASIQRSLRPGLKAALADLVEAGRLSVQSERWNNNPSVKLLKDCEIEAQLKALEEPGRCALYPTEAAIHARFDLDASYRLMPYSRRLAESEPQLTPVFFDLGVLERYREDPRYRFKFPHGRGSITWSGPVPADISYELSHFG